MIERARRGERSVLEDIEHIAHSVHGSGAMFGFPEISMLGGDIERLVDGSMANTATPTLTGELAVLQQLSNHVERLAQEVQAAANVTPSSLGMFQGEAMADRTKS
jgi:chemotaxis protein histidine kinase CheA